MQVLFNSPRVQSELSMFENKIKNMPEGQIKQETLNLLNKLITEIKKIDSGHQELLMTKQVPMMLPEARENVTELRKKLYKKLEKF